MDKFKESTPFIEPFTPDHDWTTVKFLNAQIVHFGYIVHICTLIVHTFPIITKTTNLHIYYMRLS